MAAALQMFRRGGKNFHLALDSTQKSGQMSSDKPVIKSNIRNSIICTKGNFKAVQTSNEEQRNPKESQMRKISEHKSFYRNKKERRKIFTGRGEMYVKSDAAKNNLSFLAQAH